MRNSVVSLCIGAVLFMGACVNSDDAKPQSQSGDAVPQWLVNESSKTFEVWAKQGPCKTGLPETSLSGDMCFVETPVATLNIDFASGFSSFCVATHEPGSANQAALLVVNDKGEYAAEALGNGNTQVLATVMKGEATKIFVGFPKGASNQKVLVRGGRTSQFRMQSPACSF